jgi:hypothetical protein
MSPFAVYMGSLVGLYIYPRYITHIINRETDEHLVAVATGEEVTGDNLNN